MTETTSVKKLNIPESTTYIKLPLDFRGKPKKDGTVTVFTGLDIHAQLMLGLIYTLNRISFKKFHKLAKITYDDFTNRFGMSHETISKYKKELIARGIIEEESESHYNIIVPFNKRDYVIIDDYLHTTEFEMTDANPNKKRQRKALKRLTRNSAITVAFLTRANLNPKTGGVFISSQSRIGVALGMPRTTAGDSVREIVAASLCTCSVPDGRNADCKRGLTKYDVAPEVLAVKRAAPKISKPAAEPDKTDVQADIEIKKPAKKRSKRKQQDEQRRGAELQARIDTYYSKLRAVAEELAESTLKRATSDSIYGDIRKRFNTISYKLALAEVQEPDKAPALALEAEKLEAAGNKRLAELGIDKAEFKPRYKCRTCNDTGYDSGGKQCACMRKLIEEMKI